MQFEPRILPLTKSSLPLHPSNQIEQLMKQYTNIEREKGKEINEYMAKHQIRFVEPGRRPDEEAAAAAGDQAPAKPQQAAGSSAVLIGE